MSKSIENKKLERILSNIILREVSYLGQRWKIGDNFSFMSGEGEIHEDVCSIDLTHWTNEDSSIYGTELRLNGQNYAVNIEKCYKTPVDSQGKCIGF